MARLNMEPKVSPLLCLSPCQKKAILRFFLPGAALKIDVCSEFTGHTHMVAEGKRQLAASRSL